MILFFVAVCVMSVKGQYLKSDSSQHFCADFHPQEIFDFNQILGRWYATEVIFHEKEENERIKYHNVCPIIHLSEVTPTGIEEYFDNMNSRIDHRHNAHRHNTHHDVNDNLDDVMRPLVDLWNSEHNETKRRWSVTRDQEDLDRFKNQSFQRLKIVWNEQGTRDEYSLKYNVSQPGHWMSFGPLDKNNSYHDDYKHHFVGTVQVLRAVRTHMVLTFCHISHRDQFFSVILTREPWMETRELYKIHQFLERKWLTIKHVRRMCMDFTQNGGVKVRESLAILVLVLAYIKFVK